MNTLIKSSLAFSMLASIAYTAPASAATFTGEGTAAGAQCLSRGVNNAGIVVGNCKPGNSSGPSTAWVALTPGVETPLTPLVSGQSCAPQMIDNSGQIGGVCKTADNRSTAVVWNSASPGTAAVALPAVSIFGTGLLAETYTLISAYNHSGVFAGGSFSGTHVATAVLWFPGSPVPLQLSALHDACLPASVNNTPISGVPSTVINCPDPATGNLVGKIVQKTGLLGALVTTTLPVPAGSTHCSVSGINDAVQMLGTCHFTAPDVSRVVYWASPSAAPVQLSTISGVSGTPQISSNGLNNNGNAVVSYQDNVGHKQLAFWIPSTGTTQLIPEIPGGTHIRFVGLSDNDTVALTSENAGEHSQAGTWTSAGGTAAIPQFAGGQESGLTAISANGAYVAGGAEDSAGTDDAVVATLP